MIITAAERDTALATLIDTGGAWDPAALWLGVYTSITDAGDATEMGDVTVPAGPPGARVNVGTWSDPLVRTNGDAVVMSDVLEIRGDDTASTTAQGAYIGDASVSGNLLAFEDFPNGPIPLPDSTAAFGVIIKGVVGSNGTWGFEMEVINGGS